MFKTFLKLNKIVGSGWLLPQTCKPANLICVQKREISFLLNWFIQVFNGVDRERLKLVGPDCACAEWLLRNGAFVRFRGHQTFLSDYDELMRLEETGVGKLKIEEVYGRDASLSSVGFNHFKDCRHVKKATFIFCSHLNDSAMSKLGYLKKSLEHLEMRSCFNVSEDGLIVLHNFRHLKTLILSDMVSVRNKEKCEADLRTALPRCNISFEWDN